MKTIINNLQLIKEHTARESRVFPRSYQSLTFPEDREFELGEIFRIRGINAPTHCQFTYMRHVLRSKGFIRERIHGREEWWIKTSLSKHYDPEKLCTYTEETFAAKFLPGVKRPLTVESKVQIRKIMRSKGLVYRMSLDYWSYKQANRTHLRRFNERAKPPRYIKIPQGSFTLRDFLTINEMSMAPHNYEWARRELRKRKIERIHGSWRYAQRNEFGKLPASVRGSWDLPKSEVFTTFEFQKFNHALKPTLTEWQSALDFLAAQKYIFDPKWRRWRKL